MLNLRQNALRASSILVRWSFLGERERMLMKRHGEKIWDR